MKNQIKKIGALVLAGVLVLGMSVTALAAETMDASGVLGGKDVNPALNNVLQIPKTLKVFNPDETEVYAPNISYSYTIEAGSAEKYIKDSDDIMAQTKAPTSAQIPTITSNSLNWSSATTKLGASVTGDSITTANRQNLELTFTPSAFTSAGVYRYKITETVDYSGTGVTEGTNTDHELFLDVYVKDTDGTTPGQYIYGYVLHTGDDGTDVDPLHSSDTKVEGFVNDEYHTSNLVVSKTLSGDAAMNSHQFPMAIEFAVGSATQGFHLITGKNGTATVAELADKTYADDAKVSNASSVKYTGIPAGATFTITETNDVAGTTYDVKYSIDGAADVDAGSKFTNDKAATTTTSVVVDTAHTIAFTNTLKIISPTGVALRFAPYAVLFAAGIALLFVFRRRRDTEED